MTISQDAHAVLLPAVPDLAVQPWMGTLLHRGTVAVLAGESREEYVAREMSRQRRATESARDLAAFTARVRALAGAPTLVAVDQEPWGIRRLHDLVPPYPAVADLAALPDAQLLLVAGGPHVVNLAGAIAHRAADNAQFADTVAQAAARVRTAAAAVA